MESSQLRDRTFQMMPDSQHWLLSCSQLHRSLPSWAKESPNRFELSRPAIRWWVATVHQDGMASLVEGCIKTCCPYCSNEEPKIRTFNNKARIDDSSRTQSLFETSLARLGLSLTVIPTNHSNVVSSDQKVAFLNHMQM
jgi:hypothetical protein